LTYSLDHNRPRFHFRLQFLLLCGVNEGSRRKDQKQKGLTFCRRTESPLVLWLLTPRCSRLSVPVRCLCDNLMALYFAVPDRRVPVRRSSLVRRRDRRTRFGSASSVPPVAWRRRHVVMEMATAPVTQRQRCGDDDGGQTVSGCAQCWCVECNGLLM